MMASEFSCAVNRPDTLLNQCINYCMNNLDSFTVPVETDMIDETPIRRLKPGVVLPGNLSNKILEYMTFNLDPSWYACYETLLHIFEDTNQTQLSRVQFRNDVGLTGPSLTHILARHPVKELDIPACGIDSSPDGKSVFSCVNTIGPALQILKVRLKRGCSHCVHDFLPMSSMACRGCDIDGLQPSYRFNCCNLQALVLKNVSFHKFVYAQEFLEALFEACGNSLKHLDLSGCNLSLNHLDLIVTLKNVISLVLADTIYKEATSIHEVIDKICKVGTIRHLDISQSKEEPEIYPDVDGELQRLVDCIPTLTSLDISGTNLCGSRPLNDAAKPRCGIPALEGRSLRFLGLWNCLDDPWDWENLPADRVTGAGSEVQLYLSLQVYRDNEQRLADVLLYVVRWLQFKRPLKNPSAMLEAILASMRWQPNHARLLTIGFHCLFLLTIVEMYRHVITSTHRRQILEIIMVTVSRTPNSVRAKHCMDLLLRLDLPQDAVVFHVFRRYCETLISVLYRYMDKGSIERKYTLRLLHNCCRANHKEKQVALEAGAMSAVLHVIKTSLATCDVESSDDLGRAWSCLWSLTDDMPLACERFMLDKEGPELWLTCKETFSKDENLLRKLTGLLSNIGEVDSLRPLLMTEEFLSFFCKHLSPEEGSDSYHCASIVAQMVVDSPETWTVQTPTRALILEKLETTINSWDLTENKKIKYRTLSPMLHLAQAFDVPEAQLWGVWALCNLTTVQGDTYCRMLYLEGGEAILQKVLDDPRPNARIRELVTSILQQYRLYLTKQC